MAISVKKVGKVFIVTKKKKATKAQKDAALARLKRSVKAFRRALQGALDVGVTHKKLMSFTYDIALEDKDKS